MKRPLTILMIAVLTILVVYACSSTIRTANTSFVTITIGGNQGSATLHAEAATPWARFIYYLAEAKLISEAYAYIPSVVQAIVVTVTAPDMTTPIVGISNLSSNQMIATIRIEVPNGLARKFTIEGIHGATSLVTYRASTEADLNGTEITLPISMQFNFSGSAIFVDTLIGNDLNSGLTFSLPLKTITKALSLQTTSTPYTTIPVIWVDQGDYLPVGAGGSESFPLPLNPGTAIICGGKGFTSVIGTSQLTGLLLIRGNDNASIDNCLVKVGSGGTGVSDMANPQLLITAATRINGSAFEVPAGATAPTVGVSFANDKSVLIESSITGTGSVVSAFGLQVNGGTPKIINSTVANLPTGIDLTSTAGNASITGSIISGNTTGIAIASGSPDVSSSQIVSNSTGIQISNGNPTISTNIIENNNSGISITGTANGQITGNTIDQNNFGISISVSTGAPVVNANNIFCNFSWGVEVSSGSPINLKDNAWSHDATTAIPGPVVNSGNCFSGDDICVRNAAPDYIPFRTAVPVVCIVP